MRLGVCNRKLRRARVVGAQPLNLHVLCLRPFVPSTRARLVSSVAELDRGQLRPGALIRTQRLRGDRCWERWSLA